jgi:hypothetical protein
MEVGSLQDKTVYMKGATREKVNREVDRVLGYIRENVFPIHKIRV